VADTEFETSVTQAVEGGVVFGDPQRIMIRQQRHRRADANLRSSLRNRGTDHRRTCENSAERMKMMLGEPDRAEAQCFGITGLVDNRVESVGAVRIIRRS
jgi:hypothetical protein